MILKTIKNIKKENKNCLGITHMFLLLTYTFPKAGNYDSKRLAAIFF